MCSNTSLLMLFPLSCPTEPLARASAGSGELRSILIIVACALTFQAAQGPQVAGNMEAPLIHQQVLTVAHL